MPILASDRLRGLLAEIQTTINSKIADTKNAAQGERKGR